MFVNSKLFHRHQAYHLSDRLSKTRRLLLFFIFQAAQKRRIRKRVTCRLGLTGGAYGSSPSFRSRSPPTSTPEWRNWKDKTDVRISCGTIFIQQCTSDMATSILAECFNHPIDSLSLANRHISTHSFSRHKMNVNGLTSRFGRRQNPLNRRPDGRLSRSGHSGKKFFTSVGIRTPDRVQ
jgi:hypothetical protein